MSILTGTILFLLLIANFETGATMDNQENAVS